MKTIIHLRDVDEKLIRIAVEEYKFGNCSVSITPDKTLDSWIKVEIDHELPNDIFWIAVRFEKLRKL